MKQQHVIKFESEASEIQLIYKSKIKASDRRTILNSEEAVALFRKYWSRDIVELQEEFKIMYLNRANKVLGIYPVSIGGIAGTVADPRLVILAALRLGASSIIIAHNHPSGNLQPSEADRQLTRKLYAGAAFFDIRLIDHLILTAESFHSLGEAGLL